jgi:hypothetical protein
MVMSESKHISGPWVCEHFPDGSAIKKYNDHEPHEDCSGNLVVAEVSGNSDICKANAELIAAAPDLLEALRAVLGTGLNGGNNVRLALMAAKGGALDDDDLAEAEKSERAVDMARAAIAKACGDS